MAMNVLLRPEAEIHKPSDDSVRRGKAGREPVPHLLHVNVKIIARVLLMTATPTMPERGAQDVSIPS